MSTLAVTLDPEVARLAPTLSALRRAIHQYPEPGFAQFQTVALVAERLRELGLEVRTEVAKTGVVGLLRGGRPGRTLLLRADMDCLSVEEATGAPYALQRPGYMHACGHDGHVAMLLGVAEVLTARRGDFDEAALPAGVQVLVRATEAYLGRESAG
ncbi:MAG TPA: M20/M25/M40 family metallo-hydrolase [Methylomirabilota bacterium]|jgi:amidohydrolase|nr:M20/M25/M40 family metallo-hydrolase [Methylomirabilota bacterium]